MKNLKFLLAVPLVAGALYGCNKDEVKDVSTNEPVDSDTAQLESKNVTAPTQFTFTEFSLDVDYSFAESYEVEYENEKSGIEAEIEDDRKNEKLRGDEAYAKLEPLLKQLTFDSTTPNDEVIDQVISVFNIADDYKSIEVEVKFEDGLEKKFKRVK